MLYIKRFSLEKKSEIALALVYVDVYQKKMENHLNQK